MKTRLLRASAIAILIVTAGCNWNHPKKISKRVEPPSAPQQEQPRTAPSETVAHDASKPDTTQPDFALSLARQTEQYAKAMDPSFSKHAASAKQQQAAQESVVTWLDPSDFRLGPVEAKNEPSSNVAPSAPQPAPAPATPAQPESARQAEVKPAIDVQPTVANQPIWNVQPSKVSVVANAPIALSDAANDKTAYKATEKRAATPSINDPLELRLAQRVKDYPRDVSAQLDYQLLLFLKDESVPNLQALAGLPTEDRELICGVLDGISNFRSALRADNNMLLSKKISPLTDLADRLRAQADLSIPTLVLCKRVDGFGKYDPMDPPTFIAGKEQQAIIYCELANFSSKLDNEKKQWQTEVTQEAVLYMESGPQVWSDKTQTITDACHNRRHDFFLRTVVTFPNTLTIGRYLLKVTIVDKQSNRVAEASLPMQVVAQ
jgi:hypothetical protein